MLPTRALRGTSGGGSPRVQRPWTGDDLGDGPTFSAACAAVNARNGKRDRSSEPTRAWGAGKMSTDHTPCDPMEMSRAELGTLWWMLLAGALLGLVAGSRSMGGVEWLTDELAPAFHANARHHAPRPGHDFARHAHRARTRLPATDVARRHARCVAPQSDRPRPPAAKAALGSPTSDQECPFLEGGGGSRPTMRSLASDRSGDSEVRLDAWVGRRVVRGRVRR